MPVLNAMSVDVEDYFQVQAFARAIPRDSWDSIAPRLAPNLERTLALFDEAGVRATFFTLGWVAERQPALVRRIVAAGHELASHGYGHQLAHTLSLAEFTADVTRARAVLEDAGGVAVRGYRAPTFSIGPRNPWAFDVLEQTGHRYSSSVFPIRHDLYGDPAAPRVPHRPGTSGLVELPMSTVRLGGRNLPCSGGGWFRLAPYPVFRTLVRRMHRAEGRPAMFYFHPWELDPAQPRVPGCGPLSAFRHRVGLAQTAGRLRRLLSDFRWGRVDEAFAEALA